MIKVYLVADMILFLLLSLSVSTSICLSMYSSLSFVPHSFLICLSIYPSLLLPSTGPPTTRTPTNVSVVDGSEASLVCPVAGYPLATVSWTLHGRPLTPTTRRTPRGDGTLAIQRVEAEYDVGHYSCIASDAQGRTATATFFLSVVSKEPWVLYPSSGSLLL